MNFSHFLSVETVLPYGIIFARVFVVLYLAPIFGEQFISNRIRLYFAFFLTLTLKPFIHFSGVHLPFFSILFILLAEMSVGLIIGLSLKLFMYVFETSGAIIASAMGFSNAFALSPLMSQQASIIGGFLSVIGMVVIVSMHLHHDIIYALLKSYDIFKINDFSLLEKFPEFFFQHVQDYFAFSLQLSLPFIVFVLCFYTGMGLIARLTPQIQIFFVSLPIQIYLALLILGLCLPLYFATYSDFFISFIKKMG